jgi:hypothetical protein
MELGTPKASFAQLSPERGSVALHCATAFRTMERHVCAARAIRTACIFGVLSLCVLARPAGASVGVVLNESLHESMDRITGTGHTAVYFSNICPQSPVKLRLCEPGELGSVMSVYINIGEDQSFGWNIVPLSTYLYGVEDPANRPLFASYKVKRVLEDRYRDNYLKDLCSTAACQTSPKAEWREMVAATLIRSVYIFAMDTTREQDEKLIAEFNASENKNQFNGLKRNCADFARHVINEYFPGAVKRDYINDFGMTSPKAVARTFSHYAEAHPDANFRVMHFAQAPGTIQRSSEVRAGTEQLYRSKKWLVPLAFLAYHELPAAAASYMILGRFNPESTFEKYAAVEPDDDTVALLLQRTAGSPEARAQFVGTSKDWSQYRETFNTFEQQNKITLDTEESKHFFKELDRTGTASVDNDGSVWMEISQNGEPLKVGLSADNVLDHGSNPHLACEFLIARAAQVLKSPRHRRETMQEFQRDWANLQHVSLEIGTASNGNSTAVKVAESKD